MKPRTIKLLTCVVLLLCPFAARADSTCFGTTSNGRLEAGVKLPGSGDNFTSYGSIPDLAGRTYVHGTVREIVVAAYGDLAKQLPGRVFKYAETGFKNGGPFEPHKTHRNGLSVDFMVPVKDRKGKSVHLPTHVLNRYGYDIEFDTTGRYDDYRIDFEALGAHIVALHKAALAAGVDLWRVIFDPKLQPLLYKTAYGPYIRQHVKIPDKRSWVRHDEHFHVDFDVPCRPLEP